jgi:hypothetical protein
MGSSLPLSYPGIVAGQLKKDVLEAGVLGPEVAETNASRV